MGYGAIRMRCFVVVSLCLVACRDDLVDPSDVHFEVLCDERGPVELLRLEDDEEIGYLGRVNEDGDLHVVVSGTEEGAQGHSTAWRRNVVIDRCGEEAIEAPSDPSYLSRWDDALIACVDWNLVQLASYDDPSPTILTRGGCAARRVGDRFVAFDVEPEATVGRLVSLDVAGSEVEIRTLVEDVLVGDYAHGVFPGIAAGRAFVQTSDLAVVSVEPATGAITLELEEAESWSASAEALAYRVPALDPNEPAPLLLRDRSTGTEQAHDLGIPRSWWLGWWGSRVLAASATGPTLFQRWFRVDPVREIVAPEGTQIEVVRDDGLVWLGRFDETNGDQTWFRWREGETPQAAWTCRYCGLYPSPADDHLHVLVQTPREGQYQLWRLDDAGGPALRLADEVSLDYLVLDDGRVLTTRIGSDYEHGPLRLSDGKGGPAVTLVSRVNRSASLLTVLYDVADEIVYEAVPHQGTHALYRAKLAQ